MPLTLFLLAGLMTLELFAASHLRWRQSDIRPRNMEHLFWQLVTLRAMISIALYMAVAVD